MLKLVNPKSNTFQIKITIDIPDGPKGFFTGNAIRMSEPDKQKLIDEGLSNAEALPKIYESFDGLGDSEGNPVSGEKAFDEVLNGKWSSYLLAAAVTQYFGQYYTPAKNARR
jgi:hypothetical protein